MSNNTRLIIAFILFFIYGIIALYSGWLPGSMRSVEEKLFNSATQNISENAVILDAEGGAKDISVYMDGQKAIVSGIARSADQRSDIIDIVESSRWSGGLVTGGVTVVDANALRVVPLPAKPDTPFIWSAEKNNGPVILSGMVPDEASSKAIFDQASAQFPEGAINRMTVTQGAPEGDWLGAARRSLNVLAQLQIGKATGNGPNFKVTGRAANLEIAQQARNTLRNMPDGYRGDPSIDVTASPPLQSPYLWGAKMDDKTAPITLTGYVPDRETANDILAYAKTVFSQRVMDNMVVAAGVPSEKGLWLEAVKSSLTTLAGLDMGEAKATDLDFTVIGTASSEDTASNARLVMSGFEANLGEDFEGTANITVSEAPKVVKADVCQALFDKAMSETTINFETGKALIKSDSYLTLDRLAVAARRCSAFKVSIGGHTDSQGSAENNQALSERRAKAVVDYLVKEGVDTDQLEFRGFGEASPVADNNTSAGRARNRRIEFKIIQ